MNDDTLFDVLKRYADSNPARFHMPGHKGSSNLAEFKAFSPFDVTEIDITDDLSAPYGAIKHLEERFASLYNAKSSLLLVNGSTTGNIAMLLSLGISKRILVARNCHKSVFSGAALAGHELISIFPDANTGRIIPEEVESALRDNTIDAVFITSPTYYGICSDVDAIAEIAHNHGAKLFVDCAHGAHFPFSKLLPNCPDSCDAWVVSCHKTLNSLTQSALLNIGHTNNMSESMIRKYVSMVQSSSPSYLLMLSLENALENRGDWNAHCKRILEFRQKLMQFENVKCMWSEKYFDFTRLTLTFLGYTGYEFGNILKEYGIYPEMADYSSVVLITTPNDPDEWYERLLYIFSNDINLINKTSECKCNNNMQKSQLAFLTPGVKALSIREAVFHNYELLPLEKTVGRIAAQSVGVYPPGIAAMFPGEIITLSVIQYLKNCIDHGARLFGLINDMVPVCV